MKKMILGDSARLYMNEILSGCPGAARVLADQVSKRGGIFAPMPPETTEARALNFETGGLLSQTNALCWMFDDLRSRPDGTLVAQDIWSQPSDLECCEPRIQTYFTEENEVYFYLPLRSLSLRNLKELHKHITSFQFVGFYLTQSRDYQFPRHRASTGFVESLAQCASAVYISAYDQESWLVWDSAL